MNMIPYRVSSLLMSRLCHDLVSPIGAVNNGMELLKDDASVMGAGFINEAIGLAGESGQKATALLRFFRVAYGVSGGDSLKSAREAFDIIAAYLDHYKIDFDPLSVSDAAQTTTFNPSHIAQILLNAVLVLQACLPRGGSITCRMGDDLVDEGALILSASSEYVRLNADMGRAMEMGLYARATDDMIEELTPRNVQGYFLSWLCQKAGRQVATEDHIPGRLRLIIRS